MALSNCLVVGLVLAGTAPCAAGPSAIPIGPVGASYMPRALNDQGDVLFQYLPWDDYIEGDPSEQAVLIGADGATTRIKDPGWDMIFAGVLGPSGEFVVGLGWIDYANELPTGGVPVRFEPELVKPDGSRVRMPKIREYAEATGFTADGKVLGMASDVHSVADDYPIVPFVWDVQTGRVTELALPANTTRGIPRYTDNSGRVIGWATDNVWGGHEEITWWNPDGTIATTFDLDRLHAIGVDRFWDAGVLADGSVVGYDNTYFGGTRMLAVSPDGNISAIPIDVGLETRIVDVNSAGYMIGLRFFEGPLYTRAEWMIWDLQGHGFPLDRFLPPELERSVAFAIDINENGDVLVQTSLSSGGYVDQTYVITGLPSPATGAILGIGSMFTATARRRRVPMGANA